MHFFRWWIRQLSGLASACLLPLYVKAGEAAILETGDDTFVLHVRRRGRTSQVNTGSLADLAKVLATAHNLPRLRLLRLPLGQVLRKRVELPASVRRNLKNVLVFEIDRETPFEPAEVYWDFSLVPQPAKGRLEVDLIVVPRTVGDALSHAAREYGFAPAALEVTNADRPATQLWLEAPNLPSYFRMPDGMKMPYLAVACGAFAALLLLPFVVQQARLFLADRTIAGLQSEARAASALSQAANRRIAGLAFMAQSHHDQNALEILASASRALPDDTFLTSFSVHGGQVSMAGSSQAAAKLIGALATSGTFRDPVFDAAVLQNQGDDQEKFTISARLSAAGGP